MVGVGGSFNKCLKLLLAWRSLREARGTPSLYHPTVELLPPGEIKAIRGAGPHWRLLGESNPEPYRSAPGPLLGPFTVSICPSPCWSFPRG